VLRVGKIICLLVHLMCATDLTIAEVVFGHRKRNRAMLEPIVLASCSSC
jgi:hypothetical protein